MSQRWNSDPWKLSRCDRILWHGKGLQQLLYKREEIFVSDHRPVIAVFLSEVEVLSENKITRSIYLFKNVKVEIEELLFQTHNHILPRKALFEEWDITIWFKGMYHLCAFCFELVWIFLNIGAYFLVLKYL